MNTSFPGNTSNSQCLLSFVESFVYQNKLQTTRDTSYLLQHKCTIESRSMEMRSLSLIFVIDLTIISTFKYHISHVRQNWTKKKTFTRDCEFVMFNSYLSLRNHLSGNFSTFSVAILSLNDFHFHAIKIIWAHEINFQIQTIKKFYFWSINFFYIFTFISEWYVHFILFAGQFFIHFPILSSNNKWEKNMWFDWRDKTQKMSYFKYYY